MRLTQDVVAGMAVTVLAVGTVIVLSRIPQTSYQAIAPDLFPRLCAYGLGLGGLALVARGIMRGGSGIDLPPWRSLVAVLGSVVLFGALAPRIGYAPAGLLTLVVSGLGSPDLRPRQLLVFSLGLIGLSVLLFSYLLKISIPILVLPGFRL